MGIMMAAVWHLTGMVVVGITLGRRLTPGANDASLPQSAA